MMMMRPGVLAVGAIAALCTACAHGQVATWYWTVSDTGNGDGIIEPGESALLTLWMAFEPRQDQPGGGLAQAGPYDIAGSDTWSNGVVESWERRLGDFSDPVAFDSDNTFLGVDHFQHPRGWGYGVFVKANPIDLFFIQWTPATYSPHAVTLDCDGPDAFIWIDDWGTHLFYTGVGGFVSFHVVPAPASVAAFLAFAAFTGRRARGGRASSARR
ncbi:MAG: hypothetical protein KIS87_08760 [Phycisphaeraceae bacterium]|nr:hypothetical protein [Phycisphaeraceae bacterium]